MLEKQRRTNIIRDQKITFPIRGKIVKFSIKARSIPENVRVRVLTEEGEVVFDDIIENHLTTETPVKVQTRNLILTPDPVCALLSINGEMFEEIVEMDPIVVEEVIHSDYYYAVGNVMVTITGLQEGESLSEIKIISDKDQPHD